jgi:hypothetical protein
MVMTDKTNNMFLLIPIVFREIAIIIGAIFGSVLLMEVCRKKRKPLINEKRGYNEIENNFINFACSWTMDAKSKYPGDPFHEEDEVRKYMNNYRTTIEFQFIEIFNQNLPKDTYSLLWEASRRYFLLQQAANL